MSSHSVVFRPISNAVRPHATTANANRMISDKRSVAAAGRGTLGTSLIPFGRHASPRGGGGSEGR